MLCWLVYKQVVSWHFALYSNYSSPFSVQEILELRFYKGSLWIERISKNSTIATIIIAFAFIAERAYIFRATSINGGRRRWRRRWLRFALNLLRGPAIKKRRNCITRSYKFPAIIHHARYNWSFIILLWRAYHFYMCNYSLE